jgi:hypothetical protein
MRLTVTTAAHYFIDYGYEQTETKPARFRASPPFPYRVLPRHYPVVGLGRRSLIGSRKKLRSMVNQCWLQPTSVSFKNRMRSSRLVREPDSQCRSRNCHGCDPSILRHSGIWAAADEAVLNYWIRYWKNENKEKKRNRKLGNVDMSKIFVL